MQKHENLNFPEKMRDFRKFMTMQKHQCFLRNIKVLEGPVPPKTIIFINFMMFMISHEVSLNFIKVIPEVKRMGFSEAFIKMWEFYFVFCEAGFLERNIGDVQLVVSKSGARNIDIRY